MKIQKINPLNASVLAIVLAAFIYSFYFSWHLMGPVTEEEALQAGLTANVSTPAPPTPNVPALILNNPHQRQGQVVEVRPENIGRENPFLQP